MNTITFKLDFRFLSGFLFVVVVVMLFIWQPWNNISSRTIIVSGQATVKAEPDQFTFYPTYQATAATESAAITAVSKKGNVVVDKLVKLGVKQNQISTSVNADRYYGIKSEDQSEPTATYSITAVVEDKKLAQQILDYLVTTNPIFGVSPQSNFKTETRKELEDSARKLALADAKQQAETTVMELGIKLGSVVEISDPNWGGIIPLGVEDRAVEGSGSDGVSVQSSPKLLTGEQEVTYQISVTYRIR